VSSGPTSQIPEKPFLKPYWTTAKFVALVLSVAVVVSAVGAGVYYNATRPNNSSDLQCTNGASNPPDCNTSNPCSNGATNPPACNQYPPQTVDVSGTVVYDHCTYPPTTPYRANFTIVQSDASFSTTVHSIPPTSNCMNSGYYSINLTNFKSYLVTMDYHGGFSGSCTLDESFNLQSNTADVTQDWTC
jgi:hypothetical protein